MSFGTWLNDGTSYNYAQTYSLAIVKIISLIGSILIFVSLLLHLLILRSRWKMNRLKVYTNMENLDTKQTMQNIIIIEKISNCILWFGTLILTLIFPVLSGFHWMPIVGAIFTTFFILLFVLFYQIFRLTQYSNYEDASLKIKMMMKIKQYQKYLIGVVVFIIFYSVFFPFVFQNSCLCYHNQNYGVTFGGGIFFSTKMTRAQWLPDQVCPDHQICHTYATLPSDASTSVIINLHIGGTNNDPKIVFSSSLNYNCTKGQFPSKIEKRGQREIYHCVINNLSSNTLYNVEIFNNNVQLYSSTYKTFPSIQDQNLEPLTVVFGGDFGAQTKGYQIINQIKKLNPDLIMIGGDVSYDNAMNDCYYSWDTFLSAFENIRAGRIVPLVLAVGNHDVGLNSFQPINITVSGENGPLYFNYFPTRTDSSLQRVDQRQTFNIHFIGNLKILSLDQGYLYRYDGVQESWIEEQLKNNPEYYPLIQYHNPLYPSCWSNTSSPRNNHEQLRLATNAWLPLFDQYHVRAVFENHEHQYKKTYPLYNNTVNQSGTVYFGDGSMGVTEKYCVPDKQTTGMFNGLFEAYQVDQSSHVWMFQQFYSNNSLVFHAIDPNGQLMYNSWTVIDLNIL